jgi:hypothetical protein
LENLVYLPNIRAIYNKWQNNEYLVNFQEKNAATDAACRRAKAC